MVRLDFRICNQICTLIQEVYYTLGLVWGWALGPIRASALDERSAPKKKRRRKRRRATFGLDCHYKNAVRILRIHCRPASNNSLHILRWNYLAGCTSATHFLEIVEKCYAVGWIILAWIIMLFRTAIKFLRHFSHVFNHPKSWFGGSVLLSHCA